MDRKPFRVRFFEMGDRSKKTLVFIGGYSCNALRFACVFKALAERYRVVAFDHGSWGMNSRPSYGYGIESFEAADKWMSEWMHKTMSKLDLPEKFLLASNCFGGVPAALYASVAYQRIEKLFCISPTGFGLNDPTENIYNNIVIG